MKWWFPGLEARDIGWGATGVEDQRGIRKVSLQAMARKEALETSYRCRHEPGPFLRSLANAAQASGIEIHCRLTDLDVLLFWEEVFASVPARIDRHTECGLVLKISADNEKDALRTISLGVRCNICKGLVVRPARDRGTAGMAMPLTDIISQSGMDFP